MPPHTTILSYSWSENGSCDGYRSCQGLVLIWLVWTVCESHGFIWWICINSLKLWSDGNWLRKACQLILEEIGNNTNGIICNQCLRLLDCRQLIGEIKGLQWVLLVDGLGIFYRSILPLGRQWMDFIVSECILCCYALLVFFLSSSSQQN